MEAGDELKQKNNIAFHYLAYPHEWYSAGVYLPLETGITDDRHGMIIIRNEGILETLKNGKKN